MSNNKQTSVEWLIEQLTPSISLQQKNIDELYQQAKAMHKKEIINAVDGFPLSNRNLEGAEYYTKTYGGNNEQ